LSNYPTKDTIDEAGEDDEIDEQGFSVNETNETVQNSIVSAQSLPGIPMDELQEEMMIAYAKDASLKDTQLERLEITDMSFYHSRRATEAFQNKDTSIEAIFTVPARKEGLFSPPFGDEVVIELPHGKFIKALQWQEDGKQYATWWENIPASSFKQEASSGYTYVADFDVTSITPAKDFEDRHVVRIEPEEVDEEGDEEAEVDEGDQGNGDGNGWGGDEGKLETKETTWGEQSKDANAWGGQETGNGGW
jgi:hypothetical protein